MEHSRFLFSFLLFAVISAILSPNKFSAPSSSFSCWNPYDMTVSWMLSQKCLKLSSFLKVFHSLFGMDDFHHSVLQFTNLFSVLFHLPLILLVHFLFHLLYSSALSPSLYFLALCYTSHCIHHCFPKVTKHLFHHYLELFFGKSDNFHFS